MYMFIIIIIHFEHMTLSSMLLYVHVHNGHLNINILSYNDMYCKLNQIKQNLIEYYIIMSLKYCIVVNNR